MVGGPLILILLALASAMAIARGVLMRSNAIVRTIILLPAVLVGVYVAVIRPWMLRWGATDEDRARALPGDEVGGTPALTRAITIDAPVEDVWPWLAQIGQDRGGFYSYEWLENLASCDMHNAGRVRPEWQQRAVGEKVWLHPRFGLRVLHFEPGHAIVLDGWGAFVVEPCGREQTRLIVRGRAAKGAAMLYDTLLIELPHFLMERKMLLGVKERAERAHRERVVH